MAIRYRVDIGKAIEVLLYVTKQVPDVYRALKVIYFADRKHLEKYGRLIYGDSYVAMRQGPVPSLAYDLVKCAKGVSYWPESIPGSEYFSVIENNISPERAPNVDLLSESDIECLDEAIDEYWKMPFAELQRASHNNGVLQSIDLNDFIPLEALIASLPSGAELLEHLNNG